MNSAERATEMENLKRQLRDLQIAEKNLLKKLASLRQEEAAEKQAEYIRKQEMEPDEPPYLTVPDSAFAHDTGGGRRVIRSTNNLGG